MANLADPDLQISIGIPDATEFKPEVNLNKWDGEVKMKISAPEDKSQTVSFDKDKVQVNANNIDYRMYPIGTINDGKFELDAVIKEKPSTNVFEWNIETENLDFFYQPPLNEENITSASGTPSYDKRGKGVICTEIKCTDKNGATIMERPENVVGSYAVYYKGGKSGDYSQMGGKNYKTGKAFHIYRPLVTDAKGNKVWGELKISPRSDLGATSSQRSDPGSSGILSVTVPQSFLDSATYPVTVDPTFGYDTTGQTGGYFDAGYFEAHGPYTPASGGNVTSISMPTRYGTHATFGIYADNSGTPGSLLRDTAEGDVVGSGLTTINLDSSLAVTAGTYYWLAHEHDAALGDWYDSGSSSVKYGSNTYVAGTMPSSGPTTPLSSGTINSFYATYTATGAQTTIKAPNNSGLVGYWKFDEGSGTSAGDASGNKNTGTITGASWVNGKLGKALSFNGSTDYVNGGTDSSLNMGSGNFSVSLWFLSRGDVAGAVQILYHKGESGTAGKRYTLCFDNYNSCSADTINFEIDDDSTKKYVCSQNVAAYNTWYHVVGVRDGNNLRLYINGSEDPNSPTDITGYGNINSARDLGIGGGWVNEVGWANFLKGSIDDVRIYNRALTQAEITKLYQSGQTKINSSQVGKMTDGLVGYWTFDGKDISGTNAYDRSPVGTNTGTISGATPAIGKLGQALKFNGTSDYVSTSYITNLNTWTASVWVKSPAAPSSANNSGPVHREKNFQIDWNNGTAEYRGAAALKVGGTWYPASFGTLNANIWYYLTATYDGETLIAYKDGSLITSNTDPSGNPDGEANFLTIGKHSGELYYFYGLIDDVRIYNRALSAAEVKQLYNMGSAVIKQ